MIYTDRVIRAVIAQISFLVRVTFPNSTPEELFPFTSTRITVGFCDYRWLGKSE